MKPLVHAKDDWSAQNNIAIEHNFRQLEEKLRSGYQPLDATLTAFAALTGAADKLPYFTGADAFALADFTAFGRSLVDDANAAAGRTTLGLGTAAVKNTGTSGDTVPLNNTANTWSAEQTVAVAGMSSSVKLGQVNGATTYGVVSVNGVVTVAGAIGLIGGAAGDANLYLRAATGGHFDFRVNAVLVGTLSATGWSVPGSILSTSATGGIGYATGAGGTVTQLTSKGTGVTLNKACGEITMNNAALAAGATAFFTLTNSAIAATDLLVMNHVGAGTRAAYTLNAECAAGSATIYVRNNTAGSLSEAIVIRFAVVKAVTA